MLLTCGWSVSPERQRAIAGTVRGLVPRTGRLSLGRLRVVTVALATRRELWADLTVHDHSIRWYLPLYRSDSWDIWLLAWERGQDTDWHDHGGSSGSFAVAEGSLLERYRAGAGRRFCGRQVMAGHAVAFGPGHVHNVVHGGDGPATSIHAYSPRLVAMTYYQVTGYGLVARETVPVDGPEGGPGPAAAPRARRLPART